jgi:hypothetical protein
MNKKTASLLGFVLGFLIVIIGCGSTFPNPFAPGPIIAGCLLGAVFAILGNMLGSDNK